MTDHPKPIARYDDIGFEYAIFFSDPDRGIMYFDDFEEARQRYEDAKLNWTCRFLVAVEPDEFPAKDARIAELESLVDDIFSDLDMRASMKGPDEPLGIGSGLVYRYGRDLEQRRKRALLEKKP